MRHWCNLEERLMPLQNKKRDWENAILSAIW